MKVGRYQIAITADSKTADIYEVIIDKLIPLGKRLN